jgi:hypothetical protein
MHLLVFPVGGGLAENPKSDKTARKKRPVATVSDFVL